MTDEDPYRITRRWCISCYPKADKETGKSFIMNNGYLTRSNVLRRVNDLDQEYLIIEWGKSNIQAIPIWGYYEREGWRSLKMQVISHHQIRAKAVSLSDWLLRQPFKENWSITAKSGWYKGAYIMPDGSVIGEPEQPILFIGQSAAVTAYKQVEHWIAGE